MEVPFPRAASRRLISFLTFQISMFFSASFGGGALILGEATVDQGEQIIGDPAPEGSVSDGGGIGGQRFLPVMLKTS